ncbi:MAG: glycosyltransferase [Aquamicrobium sp.]|nr:glycosyltransferase [Aquamicrobium sp.]
MTFRAHPKLDIMIWGGFSNYASAEFERLKDSADPELRYQAGWGLMRKYAADGDYERAHENLILAKATSPANAGILHFALLEMDILRALGRLDEARSVGFRARKKYGEDARINIALSALFDEPDRRLNLLSRPLATAGFARLRLRDPQLPLSIHNVAADPAPVTGGPMVSVIMPAFNAAETLQTAARGVLEQSWRNLELIIVDDASSDQTWSIATKLAETDDRVKPIRHAENAGVYRARNTGLAASSGAYITVNDADDWSHPQRIEAQMREIDEDRPFNTTFGVRVTDKLVGAMKYRSGSCVVENTSSLLVSARTVKDLGGWDEVRFSADTELYLRIMKATGRGERALWPFVPLAFILSLPESLTNSGATSLKSLHYGARREYREAAAHWRDRQGGLVANNGPRPYPLPRISVERTDEPVCLDNLLVADMTKPDSLSYLKRTHESSSRGVLHLPELENFGLDFSDQIRAFINDRRIEVVVPGQAVQCARVLIPDEKCLAALPDILPAISAELCLVAGTADVARFGARKVVRTDKDDIFSDLVTPE